MTRRLKLIKGRKEKPATITQIAAMEFAAMKEYRGLTKVERLKRLHGVADDVRAGGAFLRDRSHGQVRADRKGQR